jgi:hypothetical protein
MRGISATRAGFPCGALGRGTLRRSVAGEVGTMINGGVGDVGRLGAPDERPVDAFEKGVLLHLRGAAPGREPVVRLFYQQSPDEVPCGGADHRRVGKPERLRDDVEERGAVPGALERRGAVQELVEEDAKCPPVDGAPVALAADDFWRQVLVRAHERHGPRACRLGRELQRRRLLASHRLVVQIIGLISLVSLVLLLLPMEDAREHAAVGEAAAAAADTAGRGADKRRADGAAQGEVEVGEHDVAFLPDEHVLGFEVSVHHAQHVQVLQRKQDFRGVEPACSQRFDQKFHTHKHTKMTFFFPVARSH